MTTQKWTLNDIREAMGNLASDAEVLAMDDILDGWGYDSLDEISDEEWFGVLIPQAVTRAAQ